jgi:hypothetical protein
MGQNHRTRADEVRGMKTLSRDSDSSYEDISQKDKQGDTEKRKAFKNLRPK